MTDTANELTLEITNRCPHNCEFCSSSSTPDSTEMLSVIEVANAIMQYNPKVIHISGGEPLSHPDFYQILQLCADTVEAKNVIVHTNALRQIAYNKHVIPDILVHGYITDAGDDVIHIAKRVKQGREAQRPEVHLSCNYTGEGCAACNHPVVRPSGMVAKAPCRKYEPNNDGPTNGGGANR